VSGSNGRTSACTFEPEPGTGDIQLSNDTSLSLGSYGTGDGPDWVTVKHLQCGSDTDSFTNNGLVQIYYQSDNITLEDVDCPDLDVDNATNLVIRDSDFGPCASSGTRKCVPRIANSEASINAQGPTIEDTVFHHMSCGGGNAATCASFHTDGMAVFGSRNLVLRRNTWYSNDITNIRFQSNTASGRTNEDFLVENNWFSQPCLSNSTSPMCSLGQNANNIDLDSGTAKGTIRFNSFADQTYISCTTFVSPSPDVYRCGTDANPVLIRGNIMSVTATNCRNVGVTWDDNYTNGFGGYSGPACTGDTFGTFPTYVDDVIAGGIDYHLTGTSGGDGIVTTCTSTVDYDGASRASSNCDAGSDER
jgi:hypothetical protein